MCLWELAKQCTGAGQHSCAIALPITDQPQDIWLQMRSAKLLKTQLGSKLDYMGKAAYPLVLERRRLICEKRLVSRKLGRGDPCICASLCITRSCLDTSVGSAAASKNLPQGSILWHLHTGAFVDVSGETSFALIINFKVESGNSSFKNPFDLSITRNVIRCLDTWDSSVIKWL